MEVIGVDEVSEFLGVGEDKKNEVQSILDSSLSFILNATGANLEEKEYIIPLINEAVRIQAQISYYAIRDSTKNMAFLKDQFILIITHIRAEVERNADG